MFNSDGRRPGWRGGDAFIKFAAEPVLPAGKRCVRGAGQRAGFDAIEN
jgi:hypothetical protein